MSLLTRDHTQLCTCVSCCQERRRQDDQQAEREARASEAARREDETLSEARADAQAILERRLARSPDPDAYREAAQQGAPALSVGAAPSNLITVSLAWPLEPATLDAIRARFLGSGLRPWHAQHVRSGGTPHFPRWAFCYGDSTLRVDDELLDDVWRLVMRDHPRLIHSRTLRSLPR